VWKSVRFFIFGVNGAVNPAEKNKIFGEKGVDMFVDNPGCFVDKWKTN
jgi:hypothetical protein